VSAAGVRRVPESRALALGHQRRLRILIALLTEPGSATSLPRDHLRDLTLEDVDYHLKKLGERAGSLRPSVDDLGPEGGPGASEFCERHQLTRRS
jgi:hypothetical protein